MDNQNNEIISAVIYTFVAFFMMSVAILIFVYYSRKKIIEKEIKNKDLQLSHQKNLLNAVIQTQENERNRIAQDLHDDISSGLSVVSLNCHMLKTPNLTTEEHHQITNTILTLTDKVLHSSRRIAHDLLPPIIDKFGLHAGIEELADELNATQKVRVIYRNKLELDALDREKHLHLFRILQELINNSMRHGKADRITIDISGQGQERMLLYEDNGTGFEVDSKAVKRGLGMKNIESRVSFIEGTYVIDSKKGQGTKVSIYF